MDSEIEKFNEEEREPEVKIEEVIEVEKPMSGEEIKKIEEIDKDELKETQKDLNDRFDKKEMQDIIQDVIDDKYELFDAETMANYDADFSGEEPFFINIWSKQAGKNFGYIVFHDFLRRVGEGKTFSSTDFTEAGSRLFQKAVDDGLIKKISEGSGLHRSTRWEVVDNPIKNLEKIKDKFNE